MSIAQTNQQFGAFRLVRLIGTGRMGEVWLADDTRLLRAAAIRVLPRHVAENAVARARLIREAQIAAQLNHPAVATVYSIEEADGRLFLAVELVDGKPLASAIASRELSDYDLVRTARDVAEALSEAHAKGIVHRDIKPGNVMIAGRRVKVLDFGIAKQTGSAVSGPSHTEAEMVMGTTEYMSPEQALGQALDGRSDIFALGVMLYEALGGALPFRGGTAPERITRICHDEPKPFGSLRPDLPNELATVIGRCLAKDRTHRFGSAAEVAAALERVLPRMSRAALPVTPPMLPVSAAELPQPPVSASPDADNRMLIADDDPAIRRLFETLARREKIGCDTVSNGPEAIAALKEREYALLFLDIMMPRIDGWGVLDYIRTRSKTRIPSLFIITAFLDQSVSAADREIVTGLLYKPVDADDIAALMRECVRGGNPSGVLQRTRHRWIAPAGWEAQSRL